MDTNLKGTDKNKKNLVIIILVVIIIALGALCVYFAMKKEVVSNKANDEQTNNNQCPIGGEDKFSTYVRNLEKGRAEASQDVLTFQDVSSPNFFRSNPIDSVRVKSDGTVSVTFHTFSIDKEDSSVIVGKALQAKYGDRYKLSISDVISAYAILNGSGDGEEESLVFLKKDGKMYTINNEEMNGDRHNISLKKLSYEKIVYVYTAVGGGGDIETIGVDIDGNAQIMTIPRQ